jgi:hypothetical protein
MASNTEVGRGYVQLEINGDGMNDDIVDAVDSAGPGVGKAGEEHGETYGEGFEEGFFDRITNTLSKGLEKELDKDFKNMGRRLGNSISKSLADSVGEKIEEIEISVSRMLDNLESKIAVSGNGAGRGGSSSTPSGGSDSGDNRQLIQATLVEKMIATVEKNRVQAHAEANASIEKADRELVKAQQTILDTARKNHEAMVKENAAITQKFAEARVKLQVASNLAIEKDDERLIKAQQAAYDRAAKENEKRLLSQRRDSSSEKSIGDRIGGIFGAGSRNNALNLLGKSMGNIINLSGRVVQAGVSIGSSFSTGFKAAGEGATTLQRTISGVSAVGTRALGGISSGMSAIAAGGPASAAAIVVVVVALSAMVSVVGALLALGTALLATVVSGLVAGMGVLAGAMVAVVAAGGLLTAAFMSMTDAQKAMLKDAFRPLREEMVGIGQIMIEQMVPAFATWSTNLQQALLLVAPLAQMLGQTFAEAGNTITASFSGPGFQALATSLGVWLPSIIANLSNAFGQFLNGAAGVFAALLPYVERFSAYLERVATRFSLWANSAAGQNSIADFMDRALVSLQSLWNAVREFSGVIGDLLFSPEAMGAGNTIFDGLASTFANLRAEISAAAANGDLQRWFDDAIQFGSQLWSVIEALIGVFQALYSSGVLGAVGDALGTLAMVLDWVARVAGNDFVGFIGGLLPDALMSALNPVFALVSAVEKIGDAIDWVMQKIGLAERKSEQTMFNIMSNMAQAAGFTGGAALGPGSSNGGNIRTKIPRMAPAPTIPGLQDKGARALAGTDIPKPKAPKAPPKYVNPYKAYAESLIKEAPSIKAQIKTAMKDLDRALTDALQEAVTTTGGGEKASSSLDRVADSITNSGKKLVESAQSGLNSAARNLAGATSKSDAKKALAEVKRSQKELIAAQKNAKKAANAARILEQQSQVREGSVQQLLNGYLANQTIAEYAEARERVAGLLDKANQKLVDAISLRDQYNEQVSSSVKSFGSLLSAQAQTINGVEQALTAADITSNLSDRLEKIRAFQNNLRVLLAQGLSNDAYKQLVDAGVEQGGAYADALVKGGTGSVQEVNDLTNKINDAAKSLGGQASDRLYQAGVNAAQGLVDGLTSLGAQLDSASARLGESIAASLKKSLGINSPSRVAIGLMGYWGDGLEDGLDNQHSKVIQASNRLSDQIRVSPEMAAYATQQGASAPVSGNTQPKVLWTGNIVTPTEDPHAVTTEVLDELAERL